MRRHASQRQVTATGFSSILNASRNTIVLHGMQGVRSSSLLGSIEISPLSLGELGGKLGGFAPKLDPGRAIPLENLLAYTTDGGTHDRL
jgi:hypothetical protein